jgi:inorganic triphosphatase YgiF
LSKKEPTPPRSRSSPTQAAAPGCAPREIELKLAVPAAALRPLRARLARLAAGRDARLETTYFDTTDLLLAQNGMALRLRREGRRWLQTLKTGAAQAAFSTRGEWETAAPGGRLALGRFAASPLPPLLAAHGAPVLQPLFTTRFVRSLRTVNVGNAVVDVALDRGEVIVGRGASARRLPLLEIELELKSGRPRALFKLAQRLMAGATDREENALPLLPFTESKAARGYRLLSGQTLAPVKASAKGFVARLRADQAADAALRQVIGHGVEVLLANAQGLAEHEDPEFVHQARVALRRMRSTVRLWRKHARFPARLETELQWIGRELGAARDADVFAVDTLPRLAEGLPPGLDDAMRALAGTAQARRETARRHARAALASGRFAQLALDLLAWAHDAPDETTRRLRKLAPRQLGRALDRLVDAARFFIALSPQRRHRVRILAKRLRYALDLFAVALPPQPTAAYVERLAHLQDLLGELNDVAVARETLRDLGAGPDLQGAIGLRLAARESVLLHEAEAALHALFDAPSPWA